MYSRDRGAVAYSGAGGARRRESRSGRCPFEASVHLHGRMRVPDAPTGRNARYLIARPKT